MDGYSTHIPVLAALVARTTGPVLELGAGWYSTPLLHEMCAATVGRILITCESDPAWLQRFLPWSVGQHIIRHVPGWDWTGEADAEMLRMRYDVVLVDHSPADRRIVDARRFLPLTRFMVLHDACRWYAGQAARWAAEHAPYHCLYDRLSPTTMVVGHEPIPLEGAAA